MKKTHILLACALVLVLAGVTTLRSAEEGLKQAKATVRSVHGSVQYMDVNSGVWLSVKPNMKFAAGITIRTGPDGVADISVNGTASAVRLTNNTTLQIPTMDYVGSAREGDTTTMLNLESGSIIGNVKKISANSRYEITTPHGVAGIRGTDFSVEVIRLEGNTFDVTFNSITGVITVSAVINGEIVTRTLTTGTSWEIGENPRRMSEEMIENLQREILELILTIENTNPNGPGPHQPPFNPNPFPYGPPRPYQPPGGPPAS